MYDRILLPTDGSPEIVGVIEHAVTLAAAHDATLRPIYVVDTGTLSRLPMEASFDTVAELLDDEGEQAIATVTDVADGRVAVDGAVIDGSPSREITREAEESDSDVIVMGTYGRGGIDRWLLGSVAERVVRTSPVPVLTVPVDAEGSDRDGEKYYRSRESQKSANRTTLIRPSFDRSVWTSHYWAAPGTSARGLPCGGRTTRAIA